MKIDIKEYRVNRDYIIKTYEKRGLEEVTDACVMCGIPLVAAYVFIKEYDAENKEVDGKIEMLKKFYGYTEIIDV